MSSYPPNQNFVDPNSAPKKSKKTLWIVLGIVGGLLLLCCGGFSILSYVGYQAGTSMLGEIAKDAASQSPEVQAELGNIESVKMNFAETGKAGGAGNMAFDIVGSKGSGVIIIRINQATNQLDSATLRTSDGREIPLTGIQTGASGMSFDTDTNINMEPEMAAP